MEGARQSETEAGRRPFMPRKALALARAALRFAQEATDERGQGQQADDDRLPCDDLIRKEAKLSTASEP